MLSFVNKINFSMTFIQKLVNSKTNTTSVPIACSK